MKLITALIGYGYDSKPMIALDINNIIYLFTMPDCCDRMFFDSCYSIQNVRHIFLGSRYDEDSGGFLESLFSLLKPWRNEVNITCPKNIKNNFDSSAFFRTRFNRLKITLSDDQYQDEVMKVSPIVTGKSLSFHIEFNGRPGKFLPKKAIELGIKPGPDFKKLQSGETMYNDKGIAVTLNDCIGEPIIGEIVLMINIKDENDIQFIPRDLDGKYDAIFHLTPIEIVNNPKYLVHFPPNVRTKNVCFGFSGRISYEKTSKLYQQFVDHSNNLLFPLSTCEDSNNYPKHFINLCTGDSYIFSPMDKISFVPNKKYQSIQKYPSFNAPLPQLNSFAITFLGTGACFPCGDRNNPGHLLHTKSGFIALDVGQGFLGQLYRKYGNENGNFILSNLIAIFITHNHVDHSYGLHSLLRKRSSLTDHKVDLFCNKNLFNEIHYYELIYENCSFHINFIDYDIPSNQDIFVNASNCSIKIKTVHVDHTEDSKGCLVTIDNKYKVAYSGDRMATGNDHFVEEIGSVDLLIHEGTFCSELDTEMDDYQHSTVNHALQTSEKMKAKYTAIVHISQRYEGYNIPCNAENAFVAFDYLECSFDQIEKVCKMVKTVNQEILKPLKQ